MTTPTPANSYSAIVPLDSVTADAVTFHLAADDVLVRMPRKVWATLGNPSGIEALIYSNEPA